MHFLKNWLGARIVSWTDPFHDCWNEVKAAIQDANEWHTFADLGHVFNIAAGPWMSSANFRAIQGLAKGFIDDMHLGNDLFCHLYPATAEDLGITDMTGTESHKRQVLALRW